MFMKTKRYGLLLMLCAIVLLLFVTGIQNKDRSSLNLRITQEKDKKQKIKWVEVPIEIMIEEEQSKPKAIVKKKKKRIKAPKRKSKVKHSKANVSVKPPATLSKKKPDVKISGKKNGKKMQGSEGFNLLAKYKIPVDRYLRIMTDKGGKVVMYDINKEGVVCQVNTVTGKIVDNPDTSNMSIRGRRITDDYPKSRHFISMAEKIYGHGSYELILLLPRSLDELLYSRVSTIITEQGIDVSSVTSVDLEFRSRDGKWLDIRVKAAQGRFGSAGINKNFRI